MEGKQGACRWQASVARRLIHERILAANPVARKVRDAQGKEYSLVRKLDEGRKGAAFLAFCAEDQVCAVIKQQLEGDKEGWLEEVTNNVARISIGSKSQHVLRIYERFEFEGFRYIVFEPAQCTVGDLFALPAYHGPEWLEPVARGLLGALADFHCDNATHGDVTARNLFVFDTLSFSAAEPREYTVKLGDLGEARLWDVDGEEPPFLDEVRTAAWVLLETWTGRVLDTDRDAEDAIDALPGPLRPALDAAFHRRQPGVPHRAAWELLMALIAGGRGQA